MTARENISFWQSWSKTYLFQILLIADQSIEDVHFGECKRYVINRIVHATFSSTFLKNLIVIL